MVETSEYSGPNEFSKAYALPEVTIAKRTSAGAFEAVEIVCGVSRKSLLESESYANVPWEMRENYEGGLDIIRDQGGLAGLDYFEEIDFFEQEFPDSRVDIMDCDLPIGLALKYLVTLEIQKREGMRVGPVANEVTIGDLIKVNYSGLEQTLGFFDSDDKNVMNL